MPVSIFMCVTCSNNYVWIITFTAKIRHKSYLESSFIPWDRKNIKTSTNR